MSNYTTSSAPGAARRLWPPESCGVQPVDQAIARYRQLWDQMWATTQQLRALNERSTLAAATRADEEAHAEAIIAEKKTDFAGTEVEKLRARIAELTRKRGAEVRAVNKAAALLDAAMTDHKTALDKTTLAEFDAAQAEWLKACDALDAAGRRLADAGRLRVFATGQVERRLGYGKPLVLANIARVRDPESANVAAALRQVVAPPDEAVMRVLTHDEAA